MLFKKKPKLIFVHIPKTAGSSFRAAMEKEFGKRRVCVDYQGGSGLISDIVNTQINENNDFVGFADAFQRSRYRALSGHIKAEKYSAVLPLRNMVTFLRDPVGHYISSYKVAVLRKRFTGSLESYMQQAKTYNKQSKMLANVPTDMLGFVGITERYADALAIINHKFGCRFKVLEKNKASAKKDTVSVVLSDADKAQIASLNQADLHLYNRAKQQFEQRFSLWSQGLAYTHMGVLATQPEVVTGFAYADHNDAPVSLSLKVNNVSQQVIDATELVQGCGQLMLPRVSKVGFSIHNPQWRAEDKVVLEVLETGQQLILQ